MKKIALHWQILLGMLAGVLVGILMTQFEGGKEMVQDWIKPFGKIFINSLKLIAVPLILASLIKGVSDLKDISKLSKMGGRTIGLYLLTTVVAVSIGLFLVNVIKPGNSISPETRQELVQNYTGDTAKYKEEPTKQMVKEITLHRPAILNQQHSQLASTTTTAASTTTPTAARPPNKNGRPQPHQQHRQHQHHQPESTSPTASASPTKVQSYGSRFGAVTSTQPSTYHKR